MRKFMKRTVAIMLAILMIFGMFAVSAVAFSDVHQDRWYAPGANFVAERGIMDGVGGNQFAPNANLSRAMLATILHRMHGRPAPQQANLFVDVADNTWYTDAIRWAREQGIVQGTSPTTFAPHNNVTRQELVTMFHRYVDHVGGDTNVTPNFNLNHFTDRDQIASWANEPVRWAVHHRIMMGDTDTTLNPRGHTARAQAATLIMRIVNFLDSGEIFRAAFITRAMSNDSQAFAWREFQRLAPEFGFEMSVFAGENEPAVEFDGVLTAIANGYDAVFVNPSSIEGIVPALQQARDAGLIVGMFSSVLPEEYRDAMDFFVGSDDFLGGVQAGEFVSQHFPDGANFVEVGGQAGHSAANDRHKGFAAGIADNIIELGSQFAPTGWNTHEALAIMEDFIVRFGDQIDIVWCHWDNGASGVIEALRNAGMDDVFVIGMDGNRAGYAQVRAGTQALSVGKSFTNMVIESLRNARTMLEGGTVPLDNWIPWDMVTIDTIDSFVEPDW